MSVFLEAALQYAGRGWRCFPLKPRDKVPLVKGGFKAATVAPSQIEAWWKRWPDANIGIATGQASGIMVIDLDSPDALRRFKDICTDRNINPGAEALNATAVVVTSRGWHIYFHIPNDTARIPCSKGVSLEQGVDVRADGGYVVAPPSIHPSGHIYRWERTLIDGSQHPPLFDWAR
jgi:Bifunctional DNA primase/polymerase, N-terminal